MRVKTLIEAGERIMTTEIGAGDPGFAAMIMREVSDNIRETNDEVQTILGLIEMTSGRDDGSYAKGLKASSQNIVLWAGLYFWMLEYGGKLNPDMVQQIEAKAVDICTAPTEEIDTGLSDREIIMRTTRTMARWFVTDDQEPTKAEYQMLVRGGAEVVASLMIKMAMADGLAQPDADREALLDVWDRYLDDWTASAVELRADAFDDFNL